MIAPYDPHGFSALVPAGVAQPSSGVMVGHVSSVMSTGCRVVMGGGRGAWPELGKIGGAFGEIGTDSWRTAGIFFGVGRASPVDPHFLRASWTLPRFGVQPR